MEYSPFKVEEKKNGRRNLYVYINLGNACAECVHFLFSRIRDIEEIFVASI
jgi:hypothetical protein